MDLPTILILMGVSGCGKSTLAASLAARTGWAFAEGDDYHSEANRARMHAGIPLTDEDRQPWLAALHAVLFGWHTASASGILTCSALKQTYRQLLLDGIPEGRLVWLDPPRALLEERLAARQGHYMNPNLLDSQLATLEPPTGSTVLHLTTADGADLLADQVQAWLNAS